MSLLASATDVPNLAHRFMPLRQKRRMPTVKRPFCATREVAVPIGEGVGLLEKGVGMHPA